MTDSTPPPPPEPLDEFNEAWKILRPGTFENMDRKNLAQFVMDMCDGKIFTLEHIPRNQVASLGPMIFMPLALGGLESIPERDRDKLGTVYEYLDRAGPTNINGYPIFFSLRLMSKDDWSKAVDAYNREMDRRKNAADLLFDEDTSESK